jgi:hypothetical protein
MHSDREIRYARFPAIVLAIAICCGCSATSSAPLPEVSATQFQLEISAEWGNLRRSLPLLVEHRLSNHSVLPVCIGGNQAFLLSGRRSQMTTLHDALCKYPVVIAPPGGTAVWVTEWKGPADCIEEAEAPTGFVRAFPWLICSGEATEATLESEISLFRMRRNKPEWGVIKVVSRPQKIKLIPQRKTGE